MRDYVYTVNGIYCHKSETVEVLVFFGRTFVIHKDEIDDYPFYMRTYGGLSNIHIRKRELNRI